MPSDVVSANFVKVAGDGAARLMVFMLGQFVAEHIGSTLQVNGHFEMTAAPPGGSVRHDLATSDTEPTVNCITVLVGCTESLPE